MSLILIRMAPTPHISPHMKAVSSEIYRSSSLPQSAPALEEAVATTTVGEKAGPSIIHYPSPHEKERIVQANKADMGSGEAVQEKTCFEAEVDYYGNDVDGGHEADTAEACQQQCVNQDKCNYFTFEVERKMCWLKNTKIGRRPGKALVSGPRNCSEVMEIRELYEKYESVEKASEAVVSAFKHAWKGYSKFCYGQDELRPVSRGCINQFGMGLTLIDSLDTLHIMGLEEEFKKAREWVKRSFRAKVHKEVSVFETIIRVLGGLLSAYGLSKDKVFLDKAVELAEQLSPALHGELPKSKINLATGQIGTHGWAPNVAIIAEVGSLQVEMWYLSEASKDAKWNDYGEKVIRFLDSKKPNVPGLYPTMIKPNGQYSQAHVSFGALGDSLYEYFLKMWILKGKRDDDIYRRMYLTSIQSMMDKLLVKSTEGLWYIAEMRGSSLDHKMDHLTCFAPGMLALGYHHKVSLDQSVNERHLQAANDVAETCVQMYMRWSISPEMVRFTPYMTMGTATNFQRPETVESLFVLWQVTKDDKWRKYAWTIFQKFERHLKVPNGYASLNHVGDTNSKADKMESFLLAETYKYLYLLFQDNPKITIDSYVFNTEAHPMPVAP